jgi:hypothetical protein
MPWQLNADELLLTHWPSLLLVPLFPCPRLVMCATCLVPVSTAAQLPSAASPELSAARDDVTTKLNEASTRLQEATEQVSPGWHEQVVAMLASLVPFLQAYKLA